MKGKQQNQREKPPRRAGLQFNCAARQNYSYVSPRERKIVTDSSKHDADGAAIPGKNHRLSASRPFSGRGSAAAAAHSRHAGTCQRPPPLPPPANFASRSRAARADLTSRSRQRGAGCSAADIAGPFAPQQRLRHRGSERGKEEGGSC